MRYFARKYVDGWTIGYKISNTNARCNSNIYMERTSGQCLERSRLYLNNRGPSISLEGATIQELI